MMLDLLIALYRPVFARRALQPVNKLLFRLALSGMGVLNYRTAAHSGEDVFLRRWLPRLLAADGDILDVGANQGDYTAAITDLRPEARVHCFEPHPGTFAILQQRMKGRNVETVNTAVGELAGELELHDYAGASGSSHASVYKDVIERIHGGKSASLRVPVITLDEYASLRGIRRIALLKIDTEGHEFKVLLGCRELLRAGAIDAVQFEFNQMNVASRVFFRDFMDLLQGFSMYRLLPGGMLPLEPYVPVYHEVFAFQNIVAIRKGTAAP